MDVLGNFGITSTTTTSTSAADTVDPMEVLAVDVGRQGLVAAVYFQDFYSSGLVREVDRHSTVESTRSQESIVQNISSVGGGDDNNPGVPREAVHLREDLVQRLFPFVVGSEATARRALAANGVDLINKNDARRVLLRVGEERADSGSTDA